MSVSEYGGGGMSSMSGSGCRMAIRGDFVGRCN